MLENKKVVILLFDSFGIGQAPDAAEFGDEGSDTLGHIVDYFTDNGMNISLPNLSKKGLKKVAEYNRCKELSQDIANSDEVENAKYGYCAEVSKGKDTPSGHWEIAGVPVMFDWYYFTKKENQSCFDQEFIGKWVERVGLTDGFIDAGHASGTEVLKQHGCESCVTKKPIVYTSADSVFQVAAHEDYFGLDKLLEACEIAREILDEMGMKVGRVIARPFIGESADEYVRTGNRRDFSILPPAPTLLDRLCQDGAKVVSIGKIADIYAHQGITKKVKATGLEELFDKTIEEYSRAKPNTLIFTNFVDLDSSYGHRRDPKGYGKALEYLDSRIPSLDNVLDEDTIIVLAADHGCDPTAEGSDHTRECIPFLLWGKNIESEFIGPRETFADIGQSIADFMGIEPLDYGKSIFNNQKISKEDVVSLIDLTQLGDNDTEKDIENLCSKASSSLGNVAALCVYKQFIPTVRKYLGDTFKVATVVNFPLGEGSLEDVVRETEQALELGADEIDLVIDYKEYIEKGSSEKSVKMIAEVKKLCKQKALKVIIESGELSSEDLIRKASQDAIAAGADFIKTSTGKTPVGATLDAAKAMLETINTLKKSVGFKASGGIRNYPEAVEYIKLADMILASNYVNPQTFRFGVSSLLDNLLGQKQESISVY